jgi:Holliday junction resolvasome RuvABC DNA-binding subunit
VTAEEIKGKWMKDMGKRNFIRWYRNANHEEIKKVKGEGKRILERLLIEYTDEIEMINKSEYQISLSPNQI